MVLTSILLLLVSVIAAATLSVPAHGLPSGVVCIVPSGSTSCPSSPSLITGTVGSQLRVSIFIQNSSSLNGFDIILVANHTVLKPVGIDLTGSVLLGTPTILLLCESGILKQGAVCSSVDTIDTLHLAAAGAVGSGLTLAPTTGLLFTALYNITSASSATSIAFQTGCTTTSVSPNTCVTVANGTPTPVPETVQTAIFSSSTSPDFLMSASPASQSVVAGTSASSTITLTSVNGFSGNVTLSLTPACLALFCPTWSISPGSVSVLAGGTTSSTLTFSTVVQTTGTWGVTATGSSGSLVHNVTATFAVVSSDFSIAASPNNIIVTQGGVATSTISLSSINGFTGTVSLAVSSSPVGLNISLTPTSITLSAGATGTSTLQVPTSTTTTPGTYHLIVHATSGSISHQASITIVVNSSTTTGDFTITDSATFISIPVGSERQTTVTVASVNGFSGTVQLFAIPSSHAVTCWFTTLVNTSSVIVPSGGSASEFPTCTTGRPAGAYTLTIKGTSGSLSHSATVAVNSTDFSISGPSSISFNAGSSSVEALTFGSLAGFAGSISLSAISPSGLTVSCPTSVTLVSGGTMTATCSLSSSLTGTYNVTYTGTFVCTDCYFNGKDVRSLSTIVTVFGTSTPDFSISLLPGSLTISQGSSGTSTILASSIQGFAGTISLAATISPAGPSLSLSSSTITLSSGTNGTSTLTISTTTSTPPGTYTVFVTGTSATISHTASIALTVTGTSPPDFSLSASPSSIAIPPNTSGTSSITVTPTNGFSSVVSLTVTFPTQVTATITPTSITGSGTATLTVSGSTTGTFTLTVTGVSGSIAHTVTVTVTVTSTAVGVVCITQSGASSCPASPAALTGVVGTQLRVSVFIQGSGGLNGFDIVLLANHAILRPAGIDLTGTVLVGTPQVVVECVSGILVSGSACSTLDTIDTIELAATSALGSGITTTPTTGLLFTAIYNVTGTTTGTSIGFQTGCTNTSTGNGTCVTIANGSTKPVPETVQSATFSNGTPAPDFTISVSPSAITITAGMCATSSVTLTSVNGFSGVVALAATVSPPGPAVTLSSSSVTLASNSSATITLTLCTTTSTTPGTYTVVITGTSGTISHTASLAFTVTSTATPDFSLSSPSPITFATGTSASSPVTVHPINGFNGTVSLTLTTPAQLTATITPTSITGSGTATMTVTGTTAGTFSLTVTGTSGSITHSITISVTVTGSTPGIVCVIQSGATSCPTSPTALSGAVGTQLRVSVFIQGSGGLNGFDVTLFANHAILRPAGIDLTGTVLVGTPQVVLECVGGVLVTGSSCSSLDTIDTIELAATSALGSSITPTPTTGLLFTAIYNVTGTTTGTSLGFQTGCTNTSTSNGTCVTVANGSTQPVPETVQSATFSNSGPAPDFTISASPSTISITAGMCATSSVTLNSVNGFSGTISLNTTVIPSGPTVALSSTSVTLTSGSSATSTLTFCTTTSTPAGTYRVGIAASTSSLFHTTSVSITVTAAPPPPNFTLTATPISQTVKRGGTATYTITVTGTNGFNGTVTLTTSISPVAKNGPSVTVPSTVGPYSTSTLTVATAHSTPAGTYTITVTATSGSITHTVTITVIVTK